MRVPTCRLHGTTELHFLALEYCRILISVSSGSAVDDCFGETAQVNSTYAVKAEWVLVSVY